MDLPMLPREPACPAALTVAGASAGQQGVVCRVMEQSHADESGVGMNAARLGYLQHEAEGGIYLNMKSDPSSVTAFCHGRAVPVLNDDGKARASYTSCPVWEAEKDRLAAGERALYVEQEPETVAMGVPQPEFEDPWAQARADLDLLASH